jgi:glycosyltransferase involved in cell wall biosynthesis
MSTPKRSAIHLWVPALREGGGGIQAFSRAYVRAIAEGYPQHQITVLVCNDSPETGDSLRSLTNVSIHSTANHHGPLRSVVFALRGIALAWQERPACIVTTHLNFLGVMRMARTLTRARILSVLHGIDVWHLNGTLRRQSLRAADHLMSVSRHTRDIALRDFHFPPDRVSVMPNTFDEERFSPGPKPEYLLKRHGITPENRVLLTVSRLNIGDRLKGQRQVLIALALMRERLSGFRYLLAGSGSDFDHLKEVASELGIEDSVIFTGQLASDELPDYYRLADIFVMPSMMEGFGIVFLEAMASGKVVVAGNRDGAVDALDGGRLGVLVDPYDAKSLADTLTQLLNGPSNNTLLNDPAALHRAVAEHFGYRRVSRLMVENLRPWVGKDTPQHNHNHVSHITEGRVSKDQGGAFRLVILTEFTSPYQIEFFNAIARRGECFLEVIYMTSQDSRRTWTRPPINHCAWIVSEGKDHSWEAIKSVQDADLVVCNTYLFRFALPALWKRSASGKPWVFWGERPGSLRTGRMGRLMRKILLHPLHRQPVPIWGMGQFGIEGYQAEYGSKRPYHNLPYASNLQRFFDLPDHSPSDRVFLFSGRFTERKGADLIAIAFARVAAKHPSAKLILVGSGPLEPSMRDSLAPCANQVEWLGFQPWTEMPAALAKGAILCLPSRYDGWGLALVEGLASGMPAIGTDKTGSAIELLSNHEAGWLIPANDADALAQAMEQALTVDNQSFKAKQCAARAVTKSLDVNQAAPEFLKLCRLALENPLHH